MPTLTTGRRLDQAGQPIEGTGFSYEIDSRLAELLAQRVSPLFSQPITGEWVTGLVMVQTVNREFERGLGIFAPGNLGPAEHFHPIYDERFEVAQGEFIFKIDGKEQGLKAGNKVVVMKGTPRTFRCVGNAVGVADVETRPAARIGEVISTLFGMAQRVCLLPRGSPR